MGPWTVIELLPFLPIDPALWPKWLPAEILALAIEHAPTRPAWREAMRARFQAEHGGKKITRTGIGLGKPPPEALLPTTTGARLDELFADPEARPLVCQSRNATDDQLRAWARDPSLFGPLISNRWLPPDVVQLIFETAPSPDLKRHALEHPRAPAAVLAHATDEQRVSSPATPVATVEALLANDVGPTWALSGAAISNNHALPVHLVALVGERCGERAIWNHPNVPETVKAGPQDFLTHKVASCPSSTRETFDRLLSLGPSRTRRSAFWGEVFERRDLDLAWKLSALERLQGDDVEAGLRAHFPPALRARACQLTLERGSTDAKLRLARATGYDEATWTLLAKADVRLLERMLLHEEPLARRVALAVLEAKRPELAPLIRLHPDRDGAAEGVTPGRWLKWGELIAPRAHLLPPPSTDAIETVGEAWEDLVLCALATGLNPRVALVCRVKGELGDAAAMRQWLSGLSWSDGHEITWVDSDKPAKKKKTKAPTQSASGALTAKDLEAFLLGGKPKKKGEATDLIAEIERFISTEKPKRCTVIAEDDDAHQELGAWLFGSKTEGLVVVRRWNM